MKSNLANDIHVFHKVTLYIYIYQVRIYMIYIVYDLIEQVSTDGHGHGHGQGHEEGKTDLRSRGLCLVPMSCLSYVTDGGGGVWAPPDFSGPT